MLYNASARACHKRNSCGLYGTGAGCRTRFGVQRLAAINMSLCAHVLREKERMRMLTPVARMVFSVMLLAIVLALLSATYSTRLYVGRELWTSEINPNVALNAELVTVRGWPAGYLVQTPLGWRLSWEELALNAALMLPVSGLMVVVQHRSARRKRRLTSR